MDEPESLGDLREKSLHARLRPFYLYLVVDSVASGLEAIPYDVYLYAVVLDDHPGRIAMFSIFLLAFYQLPYTLLITFKGEVADRLPRKPVIFVSKVIDALLLFLSVSYPDMWYVLAFYAIRAITNFHTMSQNNYFLDLTLFGEAEHVERMTSGASAEADDPGDRLMSKAVAAPDGLEDVQGGSVGTGAATLPPGVVGRIIGGVLVAKRAVSLRGILYVTIVIRTCAQGVIWVLPETHQKRAGDPDGWLELFELALRESYAQAASGWRDLRARWATGEPLLLDFSKYMFVTFAAWCAYLPIFFLNMQYKYFSCWSNERSKTTRAELSLTLLPAGLFGFIAWYCHFRAGATKPILMMWRYQLILAVDLFLGSFATTFAGALAVMFFAIFTLAPTGIPGFGMWSSQAPLNKQGRLAAIAGILVTFGVVVPFSLLGTTLFMVSVGTWGSATSYSSDKCGARQNDMRPAAAMVCVSPLFFVSMYYLRRVAADARALIADGVDAAAPSRVELADSYPAHPEAAARKASDVGVPSVQPELDDESDDDFV